MAFSLYEYREKKQLSPILGLDVIVMNLKKKYILHSPLEFMQGCTQPFALDNGAVGTCF